MNIDINKLLEDAEHGKQGNVVEQRITDEAREFWQALKKRVTEDKVTMRPYVVHRILRDEFGIKISETAIRRYLEGLQHGEE